MQILSTRIRIFLLMFALGLAAVPFFNVQYDRLTDPALDLPVIASESPIFVFEAEIPELLPISLREERLVQGRDLTRYEAGGAFSKCFASSDDFRACASERNAAMKFIVFHLKSGTRGFITYYWSGVDCSGRYLIFIEPDDEGQRHVVIRTYGDLRFSAGITEEIGFSAVIWHSRRHDLPSRSSILSIRDRNGKTLREF